MRKRPQIFFIFSLLFIISLIFFVLFRYQPLQDATGLAGIVMRPLQNAFFSVSQNILHISENNIVQKLQETNQKLASQLAQEKIDQIEMKALRDQFAQTSLQNRQLIPSRVIGSKGFIPGISIPDHLILDAGSSNGVKQGQVVLVNNNLLGKISKVSRTYALVELIVKKNVALTAITGKSQALGIVKGQGSGLIFDNVILSDTLEVDDIVVTKGNQDLQGSGYPPNLVIGKITSVDKKASSLFQSAGMQSLVDFTHLKTVFILIPGL